MFGDHRLAWKWLMTPTDKLGGNSPIDTLLAGTLADVVAAARLAVEHAPDV
nr:antitoxin Xre/MbcA/ParS toxin-binding domain-containing protein [Mesorhizobium sp. LNHC221B00]